MSDEVEEKQLDEKVANTVVTIGDIKFTPAKIMIAFSLVSAVLGALYGTFEIYKDYMDMKQKIQEYVAPDLSELNQKVAVLEENTNKAVEYTRDINNTLKADIRRLEGVVDSVERGIKQSQRDVEQEVKDIKRSVDETVKNIDRMVRSVAQEMNTLEKETEANTRAIRREVDEKIKKALDNPLNNN